VVVLLVRQLNLFGATSGANASVVTLPADLVGKPYDTAVNELRQLGIGNVTRKDIQDTTHPADTVTATVPAVGQRVAISTSIELDVATGPATITEPDVVQETFSAASQQLQQAGFKVAGPVSMDSTSIPASEVISQDPPQGTQGHQGDTITLTVSDGRGGTLVPDETGKDQATAASDLQAVGLGSYVAGHDNSATVPVDSVVRTTPPAGTAVTKGNRVGLILSSGPGKVYVPYVQGDTEATAKQVIEARGLVATETTETVTRQSQDGTVIDESPAGGTLVDQGSSVNIVIGQYTAPTTTTTPGLNL
jgi:serine/threonine-protein kinase